MKAFRRPVMIEYRLKGGGMFEILGAIIAYIALMMFLMALLGLIFWIASWPWATILSIAACVLAAFVCLVCVVRLWRRCLLQAKPKVRQHLPFAVVGAKPYIKPHIKLKARPRMLAGAVNVERPAKRAHLKDIRWRLIVKVLFWCLLVLYWLAGVAAWFGKIPEAENKVVLWLAWLTTMLLPLIGYYFISVLWKWLIGLKRT